MRPQPALIQKNVVLDQGIKANKMFSVDSKNEIRWNKGGHDSSQDEGIELNSNYMEMPLKKNKESEVHTNTYQNSYYYALIDWFLTA